jgi:hypothetical protein
MQVLSRAVVVAIGINALGYREVLGIAVGDREAGASAGLIQSPSQASLLELSAWAEVGGIAPSLCLKAPPLQPIST